MTIGVKVMPRRLEQVSYVRATLHGMMTTIKHLVDPHMSPCSTPRPNGICRRDGVARTAC